MTSADEYRIRGLEVAVAAVSDALLEREFARMKAAGVALCLRCRGDLDAPSSLCRRCRKEDMARVD